jgi:hypothetical protein
MQQQKNKENRLPVKMLSKEPLVYHLHLEGENQNRKIVKRLCNGTEVRCFIHPVTSSKTPKLYIIRNNRREVLYVGYADQSISNRMRYGLCPKHMKNYHGYRWMMEESIELLVWVFEPFKAKTSVNEMYNRLLRTTIECIEAEVVYHIRTSQKKWPQHQKEIHFGNENRTEVLKWSKKIIASL